MILFFFLVVSAVRSIPFDPCEWNRNYPGCFGQRNFAEKTSLESCVEENYDFEFNDFCQYCAENHGDPQCKKTDAIGSSTVLCFIYRERNVCMFCKESPELPNCAGFPVRALPAELGETLTKCIKNATDMEACDYCREDYGKDIKCKRPKTIGYYTEDCYVFKNMEACAECEKDPNQLDCVGFPPVPLKSDIGKTLKECIFNPSNSTACDYCKDSTHSTDIFCKRPDDIGEFAVACILFESREECLACNVDPENVNCTGYTAPPNGRYGRVQRLCYENLDWEACQYCFDKLDRPECKRPDSRRPEPKDSFIGHQKLLSGKKNRAIGNNDNNNTNSSSSKNSTVITITANGREPLNLLINVLQ